jgi:hypothetical protein
MQAPVEICYAGVVIARAEEVREGEGGEFFVVMKDPPPVGTPLDVRSADSPVSVQVLHVVESADGAESGMQVRPVRPDDAGAAMWIPPPPAAKTASTPPAAATPAVAAPAVAEKPAQAAPEPAATASAPESPVASEEPARTPAVQLAFEAVEVVSPPAPSKEQAADHAPIAKAEQPAASEAVPSEPVAPAASTDSSAVPEAVPVAVASSLTGALEGAVGRDSGEFSSAVGMPGESPASGDATAPAKGDLPPARPVQGASGRRRTKRRRQS